MPLQGEILPNDARIYHEEAVTIGTRLISEDGTAENIFTAGPSSGPIGHEKDPGGKKSVTINSFAARSQALGLWLRSEYFKSQASEKRGK